MTAAVTSPDTEGTPSRRTLIFHIGDQKAGSTSIQNAFAARQIRFPGHSVIYPGQLSHNYLPNHFTAFDKTGKLLSSQPGRPNIEKLSKRLREADFDFTLLSGEQFESLDPKLVQRVLATGFDGVFDDIRVICYLRPHAARIPSSFAEAVKIGNFQGDLEQFHQKTLQRQRFLYAPRLRKWKAAFGDKLIVRPMIPSELRNGSILEDLVFSAMGPIPVELAETPRANETLGIEDLMLLDLLQSHIAKRHKTAPHQMVGRLAARLISASPRPGGSTKIRLHRALAEELSAVYIDDARAVDAEFMEGRPLFETDLLTAPERAIAEAQSFNRAEYFSADELHNIEVLARMIAEMLDKGDMSWNSFFRQKRVEELSFKAS
ncbi:hypothetical protein [Pseudodonghicola xiamenensis]|uniref:Uncharacterized protein n=1 Tax=Pseudodonghicola xiamenensis TaxID=337702 RepID=A0A8J3H9M3_9RHOB|nr:hypothetical protein [Pseudodonghicola xiamenensis]GHG97914.1 hypothetical protein GCM10010961_32970 [Pseudodonghicola xiamenensis]